jgi:hypothetical protein
VTQIHTHVTNPYTPGENLSPAGRAQLRRGVFGICDVVVEKGKVQPSHVGGAEVLPKRQLSNIAAKVVIHSLASESDHNGSEVEARQQAFSQQRSQIIQGVFVAYLNQVGTFCLQDSLQFASGRQKLRRIDRSVVRVQQRPRSRKVIDPAYVIYVFREIALAGHYESHLMAAPVRFLDQGPVKSGDSARALVP